MPTHLDLEKFRLAQSYLDKARRELARWQQVIDSRESRISRYDEVKGSYGGHVRNAQKFVDDMRAEVDRHRAPTESKLKDAKSRLRQFHKSLGAGKIDVNKANALNRAIQAEVQGLLDTLDIVERITGAKTAADLGGFDDFPLAEYRFRLKKFEKRPPRKLSEIEISTTHTVIGFILMALVGAAFYHFVYLAPRATFTATAAGNDGHVILITCRNTGRTIFDVYAPWSDGIPRPPGGESSSRAAFGVQVFVIEHGHREFRLLSDSTGAWFQRGSPIEADTAIRVTPGRTATFAMNANRLAASGMNVSAVRLVFTRTGGRKLGNFDISMEDTP